MKSRGPEVLRSKNVKTSQAYFFEGFISFFEDFSLTTMSLITASRVNLARPISPSDSASCKRRLAGENVAGPAGRLAGTVTMLKEMYNQSNLTVIIIITVY